MTFKEAIKQPKSKLLCAYNLQAQAADSISRLTKIKNERIYNWANKFKVDLTINGHILSDKNNWNDVFSDISLNKFDCLSKKINKNI